MQQDTAIIPVVDPDEVHGNRRVGGEPGAIRQSRRARAAEDQRGDEDGEVVDEAETKELEIQRCAALNQELANPFPAESRQHLTQIDMVALLDEDLSAGGAQLLKRIASF